MITIRIFALLCGSLLMAALTPDQRRLNLESFEQVWTTIRDKHWEAKPGGLDWQAVHDEFRPRMERANSMADSNAVLSEMLERLHQTHFHVFPTEVYSGIATDGPRDGDASIGVDVRVIDGEALVTSVEPESPAAKAGVHLGWTIAKVDGNSVAGSLVHVAKSAGELTITRIVLARIHGPAGSAVRMEFLDGGNKPVSLTLQRVTDRGAIAKFGFLPPMHVWLESKKLGEDVGYIRFNVFLDPARLMSEFGDAIQSDLKTGGIIIDLRGNPGGLGVMAMGMAGWFFDKPNQRLGTMYMRDATLKFVVNPRLPEYRGKVAILVDGASASTSEIFAGGMKDLGRARIFGSRTAAAALPSSIERLPNGEGFQYAQANYISEGGKPLEGIGVTPDEAVSLTRESLLAGHDPVVDAAVQWIRSQRKAQ